MRDRIHVRRSLSLLYVVSENETQWEFGRMLMGRARKFAWIDHPKKWQSIVYVWMPQGLPVADRYSSLFHSLCLFLPHSPFDWFNSVEIRCLLARQRTWTMGMVLMIVARCGFHKLIEHLVAHSFSLSTLSLSLSCSLQLLYNWNFPIAFCLLAS